MASPPTSRLLRSRTAREQEVEDIIEAVVARLTGAGPVSAALAAPVQPKMEDEVVVVDTPAGSTPNRELLGVTPSPRVRAS